MHNLTKWATPVGRVMLSSIFLLSAMTKLMDYAGTEAYMTSMGVSEKLLPIVIVTEMVLPLAVIIGFYTRLAALGLAVFSVMAAMSFHFDFSEPVQTVLFMKDITIAGGFFILVGQGGGYYSIDQRSGRL